MQAGIGCFTKDSYTRTDAKKAIILFTDGNGSYDSSYTDLAIEKDIVVYTVGLGSSVNSSLLREIAESTGGKYYFASWSSAVPNIYNDIRNNLNSGTGSDSEIDSNNDGISDYYTKLICEGKLVSGTGINLFEGVSFEALQANDDYDGDGIKNGEEATVSFMEKDSSTYICYVSDPCQKDGDSDGIPDKEDTAPFEKGLEGGIIGNVTLIASYGSGVGFGAFKSGHAFFLYESYVNDFIDFSSFSSGWSRKDTNDIWSSDNIQRDEELKSDYEVRPNDIFTIGNGALTGGFSNLGNVGGSNSSDNGSSSGGGSSSGNGSSSGGGSSSGNGSSSGSSISEANGSSYNMEIYKYYDRGYNYLHNKAISMEITENDLNALIEYYGCEEENYWSVFHNCATVASRAWNLISEDTVDAHYIAGVDSPLSLSKSIEKLDGYIFDYNIANILGG